MFHSNNYSIFAQISAFCAFIIDDKYGTNTTNNNRFNNPNSTMNNYNRKMGGTLQRPSTAPHKDKDKSNFVLNMGIPGENSSNVLLRFEEELKNRYKTSQIKAAIKVNSELIKFNWLLGKDITEMKADSRWGTSFFDTLSLDLKKIFPNSTGFSPSNLAYMKRFYLLLLVTMVSIVSWASDEKFLASEGYASYWTTFTGDGSTILRIAPNFDGVSPDEEVNVTISKEYLDMYSVVELDLEEFESKAMEII